MNIDNLMDPMGGYGYNDTINTGLSGLLIGIGASSTVMDKIYYGPMLKHMKHQRNVTIGTRMSEILKGVPRGQAIRLGNGGFINRPENRAGFQLLRRDIAKGPIGSRLKKDIAKETLSFRAGKKFFGRLGTFMLASAAFEIGEAIFTPGISKVAQQKDLQAFADESPLDSSRSYTMRQRALQAIHDSQMSVRNVLGNEASFMHY